MPLERRNEPQMLRQFHKMYPSYNINPLLRRRHQDLVEAQSFLFLFFQTHCECAQLAKRFTVRHCGRTGNSKVAVLEETPWRTTSRLLASALMPSRLGTKATEL